MFRCMFHVRFLFQLYTSVDVASPFDFGSRFSRLNFSPALSFIVTSLRYLKVGVNAGHSSLNWLLSSHPSTNVLAFDLGEHEYTKHALDFLQVRDDCVGIARDVKRGSTVSHSARPLRTFGARGQNPGHHVFRGFPLLTSIYPKEDGNGSYLR